MFEGIDRVAIAVKDLDKAVKFYSELLDIDFDVFPGHEGLGMRGGYSASGLELLEGTSPDSTIGKFVKERGEGLWCIVFKVKNMDEAIKRFAEKGLKPVNDISVGTMREVSFHPKDAFGVEITLAEYPAKHPATVAAMGVKGPMGK